MNIPVNKKMSFLSWDYFLWIDITAVNTADSYLKSDISLFNFSLFGS